MGAVIAVFRRDGRPVEVDEIGPMHERIRYRGVGAPSVWTNGSVSLTEATDFVRSTVARPDFTAHAADGVYVVADAHLVGRRELVAELRARGCAADTGLADRELIRQAYLAWDDDCLLHLQGEFAFVLWDARSRRLFAAHDQLAARELYHAVYDDVIVISTELMALLRHPLVLRELDEGSIAHFLLFSTPRRPGDSATVFRDIRRLLPAHSLVADDQCFAVSRYWEFPLDRPMLRYASREEYVAHFRSLLKQAVAERMEDVPRIVVHLSGGLDSTSLAALACELIQEGTLGTEFSAITAGHNRVAPDVEAYYAHLTSMRLLLPTRFAWADDYVLRRPLTIRSEPMQDFSPGWTTHIERESAEVGELVLSGKGGDELLTQTRLYEVLLRYRTHEAVALYRWLWKMSGTRPRIGGYREYLRRLLRPNPPRVAPGYPFPGWLDEGFVRRGGIEERWREAWSRRSERLHPTQPDIAEYMGQARWNTRNELLPAQTFRPLDYTMPFADLRLIDFVLSLPPWPWNSRKQLLRDAMATSLPEEVVHRRKQGAPVVAVHYTNQPGGEWVDRWTATETLKRFVRPDRIPQIFGSGTIERAVIDTRPLFLNEWMVAHELS
ncbi:asparagine synthase (glutamine-hydrolyzing) [soil metagenome]